MDHIENAVHNTVASNPHLMGSLSPDTLQKIIGAFKTALPVILEIIAIFQTPSPTPPSN